MHLSESQRSPAMTQRTFSLSWPEAPVQWQSAVVSLIKLLMASVQEGSQNSSKLADGSDCQSVCLSGPHVAVILLRNMLKTKPSCNLWHDRMLPVPPPSMT